MGHAAQVRQARFAMTELVLQTAVLCGFYRGTLELSHTGRRPVDATRVQYMPTCYMYVYAYVCICIIYVYVCI